MGHEHSFSRNADNIVFNSDNNEIVVKRECQGYTTDQTEVQIPSGKPSFQESPCEAVKEDAYKIRSVVDNHDYHDEPNSNSITVLEDTNPTKNSVHKDSLSKVPDWIDEVVQKARSKAESVEAQYFMCYLGGAEISMMLATSDTEYDVILTRVDERVEQ